MNDGTMSLRQWAKSRSVPLSTAHAAISSGRITRRADGRLDPARADREWGAARPSGRVTPTRSLIEAQRHLTEHKAAREKLRLRQERGELVRADEVRSFLFTVARRSRDRVLLSPNRLAIALGPLLDPADILAALEAEAKSVCADMALVHRADGDGPLARPRRAGKLASVENDADEREA